MFIAFIGGSVLYTFRCDRSMHSRKYQANALWYSRRKQVIKTKALLTHASLLADAAQYENYIIKMHEYCNIIKITGEIVFKQCNVM